LLCHLSLAPKKPWSVKTGTIQFQVALDFLYEAKEIALKFLKDNSLLQGL